MVAKLKPIVFGFLLLTLASVWGSVAIASVSVSLFTAESNADNSVVTLSWITEQEINHLGFGVWRTDIETATFATILEDQRVQLTSQLIPGNGGVGSNSYQFLDDTVNVGATYYYWLEDKDTDGNSTFHGPRSVVLTNSGSGIDFVTNTPVASATPVPATLTPTPEPTSTNTPVAPTDEPTAAPTDIPTETPVPTAIVTDAPDAPTEIPTAVPTLTPISDEESTGPSSATDEPTVSATETPTPRPTATTEPEPTDVVLTATVEPTAIPETSTATLEPTATAVLIQQVTPVSIGATTSESEAITTTAEETPVPTIPPTMTPLPPPTAIPAVEVEPTVAEVVAVNSERDVTRVRPTLAAPPTKIADAGTLGGGSQLDNPLVSNANPSNGSTLPWVIGALVGGTLLFAVGLAFLLSRRTIE